jgi:hypothetical protein
MIVAPGPLVGGVTPWPIVALTLFDVLAFVAVLLFLAFNHPRRRTDDDGSRIGVAGQPHRPAPPTAFPAVAPPAVDSGSRRWEPPL